MRFTQSSHISFYHKVRWIYISFPSLLLSWTQPPIMSLRLSFQLLSQYMHSLTNHEIIDGIVLLFLKVGTSQHPKPAAWIHRFKCSSYYKRKIQWYDCHYYYRQCRLLWVHTTNPHQYSTTCTVSSVSLILFIYIWRLYICQTFFFLIFNSKFPFYKVSVSNLIEDLAMALYILGLRR